MGGKDSNYQIVYRGETLPATHVKEGRWVFFQRPKECGGGYWLGKTWRDFFEFGMDRPVALREGIEHLLLINRVEANFMTFDDDFHLEG